MRAKLRGCGGGIPLPLPQDREGRQSQVKNFGPHMSSVRFYSSNAKFTLSLVFLWSGRRGPTLADPTFYWGALQERPQAEEFFQETAGRRLADFGRP